MAAAFVAASSAAMQFIRPDEEGAETLVLTFGITAAATVGFIALFIAEALSAFKRDPVVFKTGLKAVRLTLVVFAVFVSIPFGVFTVASFLGLGEIFTGMAGTAAVSGCMGYFMYSSIRRYVQDASLVRKYTVTQVISGFTVIGALLGWVLSIAHIG